MCAHLRTLIKSIFNFKNCTPAHSSCLNGCVYLKAYIKHNFTYCTISRRNETKFIGTKYVSTRRAHTVFMTFKIKDSTIFPKAVFSESVQGLRRNLQQWTNTEINRNRYCVNIPGFPKFFFSNFSPLSRKLFRPQKSCSQTGKKKIYVKYTRYKISTFLAALKI